MDVDKAAGAVADLLLALGVDEGEHTANTPMRVATAWRAALAGYGVDPARHLARTFTAPPEAGLVILAGIRVRSTCAHHLLPITGTATVAYRPGPGRPIVGLSKLARVLGDFAARLQVQERLGYQVAHTIQDTLDPVGAACVITAAHGCISLRGVCQPDTTTTTTALAGCWCMGDPDVASVMAEHRHHLAGRGEAGG
ncbi:GTP cyclohydrolase I [Pseudonocardia acaciae]|uniref:GTP cyclohydrolase I n=1 Tax=Pseudonocardia acaciae TaxID=551276 RepID=UPI00048B8806|nr:GTP cyclohydrolase I [Pseudonocardia acaciae]